MASKFWMIYQAALVLLLTTWRSSDGLTVGPPEDVVITDPGHLGYLQITWSLPASLVNKTECSKLYQLEYYDTYQDTWTGIRTTKTTYSALFNLAKDVRVRVYTLLSGPCTNGTMVKSMTYTEVVQKPPSTGYVDSMVQDFNCVYHEMKYVECNWRRNPKMANVQHSLYFWHKNLEQAQECPKYLMSGGVRSGCNFTGKTLPDFTDITFCVNGSSPKGPLKPTFVSLQIQNHVKPGVTEKLHVQAGPEGQLELHWGRPVGIVSVHCLKWEVDHKQKGQDGQTASEKILTQEMSLTLPPVRDKERSCYRVRSKLHKYCAEKSLWSEWSRSTCHPESNEIVFEPEWDMVPVYVYIAVAIIAILALSLCVGAVLKVRRSRQEKKPDSLLTTLFTRKSLVIVADA